MTRPNGELSSEKVLREAEKLTAQLLATVSELQIFVAALSAQNAARAERPLGEDPR